MVEWRGRALVHWALDAACASGLVPVLLITGSGAESVAAGAAPGVEVVHNPQWEEGIASSLRAALRALEARADVGAICVGLADQPRVGAQAYRRLEAAYRAGATFAVATYGGQRANPVLLARELWPEAAALTGDVGARALMRSHPVVELACDDTGDPTDVDTFDDLARLGAGEDDQEDR